MRPERIAAAKAGETHYHGEPCVNGHGTLRYVISGRCVECDKANASKQYKRRTEVLKVLRESNNG